MPRPPPHPSEPHDPLFGAGLPDDAARQAVEPVFQPQFDGDDRTDDHVPSFSSEHGPAAPAGYDSPARGFALDPHPASDTEGSPLHATDPDPLEDEAPPPLERGPATPLPPAPRADVRLAPYIVVAALIATTLLTAWWSSRP
jgi:hypothetical protein